jgi:hypothetical protein
VDAPYPAQGVKAQQLATRNISKSRNTYPSHVERNQIIKKRIFPSKGVRYELQANTPIITS